MPEDTKIPKWEYTDPFLWDTEKINEYGKKGWEIGIFNPENNYVSMKRQAGWLRVTEHVHEPEVNNEYQQDNGYSR